MTNRTTIEALAGHTSSGEPVLEELLVVELEPGYWRLVASPALVLGIAADDTFRLRQDGTPVVGIRGGNLALQVHGAHEIVESLTPLFESLGGVMDARAPALTVYTVPASVGFARVEEVLNAFVADHGETSWYYANVYGDDGATPLRWWSNGLGPRHLGTSGISRRAR